MSNTASTSQPPTLPSKIPVPTGNLVHDSLESAKHVSDLPCARNALLAGIASGAGMGAIRGLAAGPMMAGHWAIGTFVLVSLGSWHICQNQYAEERRKISQVIESMPKRTLKESGSSESSSVPSTSKS
ncbi:hypothetical protein CVT25_004186 [Psilocybe cyanescens]|uniref:Cytochrome c oxidase assembly protein COX20, mitochondrial n=1 Tax=Psilocybe cyanescens TaxID=93625 RepID=A0A409X347_PSICY|nr:hypothetical protein CVT25_004186 [Psilocybe cyanescens]